MKTRDVFEKYVEWQWDKEKSPRENCERTRDFIIDELEELVDEFTDCYIVNAMSRKK